jgi:hypothetical protein
LLGAAKNMILQRSLFQSIARAREFLTGPPRPSASDDGLMYKAITDLRALDPNRNYVIMASDGQIRAVMVGPSVDGLTATANEQAKAS